MVRAAELDARADPSGQTRVWLALEALQVTGSFKVRGALVSLDAHRSYGHVVAASVGNHGVAIAYAARVLGLSATVCVPRAAARAKRDKIERYGAELVVAPSDHYCDAEQLGRAIAAAHGGVFLSPHGNVDVVTGNGCSLGFEIVRALGGVPERVLAPFGGGELPIGLAWALASEAGSAEREVWGVKTEASRAVPKFVDQGVHTHDSDTPPVDADGPRSESGIATATFDRALGEIAGIIVATEAQVSAAMAHAYRDMGLIVEGSAATALAPVLFGLPKPVCGGDLVVVLTGRNVDPENLEAVVRQAARSGQGPDRG